MSVLKAVEERKWCPGNSSLQMLPSTFKFYVKGDFKRKMKKHSLLLKPWSGFRGSRLWLCGRLCALPLGGYWNRELESGQVVLSSGRLEVLKLESECSVSSRNVVSGENEHVCLLYTQNSCDWAFPEKVPGEILFCLWPKILNLFWG